MTNKIDELRKELVDAIATEEHYSTLEAGVQKYNEMASAKKLDLAALETQKKAIDDQVKLVNKGVKTAFWKKLKTLDKPVLTAIQLGVRTVVKVGRDTGKDADKTKLVIGRNIEIIDLAEIGDSAEQKKLFHDGQAMNWVDMLNHAFYEQGIAKTGAKASDKLATQASKYLVADLKVASFSSKNGKAKAMQQIVDAIVYEKSDENGKECNTFKADDREWARLDAMYIKPGREIDQIVFPTPETFRRLMMRVLHLIVTGKELQAIM